MKHTYINYHPKQGAFWDHWIYRAPDKKYHLYYLHDIRNEPERNKPIWFVGHAISDDLVNWTEQDIVLRPEPDKGVFSIATGSVIKYENRYAMLVSDHSNGICLAWSDDLYNWEWHGSNPVLPVSGEHYETRKQMADNPSGCAAWCDPYLFYLPDDDAVYTLVNTRINEGCVYARGCVALAKSYDLIKWEILPPLLAPGISFRCETPQILTRNGRWYLIVSCNSGILTPEFKKSLGKETFNTAALVWTSECFDGPYKLIGDWSMFENESCYICKIEEGTDGNDYVLTIKDNSTAYPARHGETGITMPYPVYYNKDGGIFVDK